MNKILLTTISSLFLLFSISNFAYAVDGHICSGSICQPCSVGADGCIEGACTENICKLDQIPPVAPIIVNESQLEEPYGGGPIRVLGVGEANTRVIIEIDGEQKYEEAVDSKGVFDLTFNPELSEEGEYELRALLVDNYDNESDLSDPVILTVTKEEPILEISDFESFSKYKYVLISGNTEPGVSLEVYKNNTQVLTTGSDNNGNFDLLLELDGNENKFEIKATNELDNSASKEINIEFDEETANGFEIESYDGKFIRLSNFDSEIKTIEIIVDDKVIERIEQVDGVYEFELNESLKSNDVKIRGISSNGNITHEIFLQKTSTDSNIMIFFLLALVITLLGVSIYYMKKKGIIKLGNKSDEQLEIKEAEEIPSTNHKVNITPREGGKEY